MESYFLGFLIFGLPFIILPFGTSFFETPKVIIAEIGIELLLIWFLLKHKLTLKLFDQRLVFLIIGLLLLSILGLLIFHYPTSLFGNSYRLQGPFLLWHLLVFTLLSSVIQLPKFVPIIAGASLLLQFIATFVIGGNEVGRSVGTLGEPNSLAAIALFTWPFLFGQRKIVNFLVLIFIGIIIIFSGSRSGLIGFAIQLTFLLLNYKNVEFKKIVLSCLVILILSYSFVLFERDFKYENRYQIWMASFLAGFKSPLIGHGFGNVEYALKPIFVEMNSTLKARIVDSSHNIFLDFWVQGGLIGLAMFCMLLFDSVKKMIKSKKITELIVFLGLLTVASFNPVSVAVLIPFWWVIAQGYLKPD